MWTWLAIGRTLSSAVDLLQELCRQRRSALPKSSGLGELCGHYDWISPAGVDCRSYGLGICDCLVAGIWLTILAITRGANVMCLARVLGRYRESFSWTGGAAAFIASSFGRTGLPRLAFECGVPSFRLRFAFVSGFPRPWLNNRMPCAARFAVPFQLRNRRVSTGGTTTPS